MQSVRTDLFDPCWTVNQGKIVYNAGCGRGWDTLNVKNNKEKKQRQDTKRHLSRSLLGCQALNFNRVHTAGSNPISYCTALQSFTMCSVCVCVCVCAPAPAPLLSSSLEAGGV